MAEAAKGKKIFLEICYDGTEYFGWQLQPDKITIQEVIEYKLLKLYGDRQIRLTGSSRTDTGVHALGFAACYEAPDKPDIPLEKVKLVLNAKLPGAIKIKQVKYVPDEFHPRYDAKGKAYTYVFNRGDISPFAANYSWKVPANISVEKIAEAVKHIEGTYDFSSFACAGGKVESNVRTIYRVDIQEFGQYLCITFIGNGFLYKMIRSIIGTLERIGFDKRKPVEMKEILDAKNRDVAAQTAPGCGLFLMKVFYGDEDPCAFRLERPPFQYPMQEY